MGDMQKNLIRVFFEGFVLKLGPSSMWTRLQFFGEFWGLMWLLWSLIFDVMRFNSIVSLVDISFSSFIGLGLGLGLESFASMPI
jgi:hypothetical protein